MTVDPAKLHAVDADDLRRTLEFALTFDGRRRFRHAEELAARITADHLVKHLAKAGYVVMREPPIGDLAHVQSGAPKVTGGR